MANYGDGTHHTLHKTLVAATEDVCTLRPTDQIIVTNRNGIAEIYYTLDGTDPAVGADNTHVVPAAVGAYDQQRVQPGGRVSAVVASTGAEYPAGTNESAVVVKLISTGAPTYTVEVVEWGVGASGCGPWRRSGCAP